ISEYTYLTANANNSATLATVTLPTGERWQYHYQAGAFKTTGMYAAETITPLTPETMAARKIIGITFPTGGNVTYQYGFMNIGKSLQSGAGGNITGYPMHIRREHIVKRTLSNWRRMEVQTMFVEKLGSLILPAWWDRKGQHYIRSCPQVIK
ncbi:hypothetical protein G3435_20930, partial [Pseudomonas sp. MAFF212428]|nr:hypothetical protein [Pseudomonas brassicae]